MRLDHRLKKLEAARSDKRSVPGELPHVVADGDTDAMGRLLAQGVNALYFSDAVERLL